MAGGRLNRNSVFFRFASEGNALEKVEFQGREIAVGDLKQAIAEKKSLPKFDLVLVNEVTNEVYTRDGAMLSKNMSVTVRRTPLQNSKKPAVVHLESTDIWKSMPAHAASKKEEEPQTPVRRSLCPPEYLCPLCLGIFDDPSIARCCGRSACRKCFRERQGEGCPICGKSWTEDTTPIHNPRLAHTVASLDLQYFITPQEQAVSKIELKEEGGSEPVAGEQGMLVPSAGVEGAVAAGMAATVTSLPGSCGPPTLESSPQTFLGPPPTLPPGVMVRPCMLTPEQFRAWQQSIRDADSDSCSSSRSVKLSRRKSKDVKKKHKRKSSSHLCSEDSSGRKKKSHKRRK